MTEHTHIPEKHSSYQKHRRQFLLQILLPMILAAILIVVVAVLTGLAAFDQANQPPIWSAISTIWLVIPVMAFGLVLLVLVVGLVYLLARALQVIPPYTARGQYYAKRANSAISRVTDIAVRPVVFIGGLNASIKAFFGRKS